ncbi:MAG: DNA-processing protein DprA [Prolixibacteraceae bacterium]|jgi:DNA processing protein|nr:DNA-processing protein DprA [Prolixibacteraceae bacterium]
MSSPLIYKIALSLFNRIGSVNARRLVAYMGSLEAVFESPKKEFKNIQGVGSALVNIVVENRDEVLRKAESEIKFIEKHRLKTYFYLDSDYPRRLAQCVDSPVIMYMIGDVNLDSSRIISVVGTRKATEYGRERTMELISGLAAQGVNALVVSGLAFGIDVNAHKAAIKSGLPTLGVVGHGLDKMYPAEHAKIAREIIHENGGLLSDFPSNHRIDPGNFLRRNRIIAGLSDCTIVIESAAKGGALVTADIANSYNRDVFAYPGRTTDEYSDGCNNMIKSNKAALIESSSDLIAFMGWEAQKEPIQQPLLIDLDEEETLIVSALKLSEVSTTDFISREVNLPVQKINSLLLNLEFKGAVKSLPGNRFKLNGNVPV